VFNAENTRRTGFNFILEARRLFALQAEQRAPSKPSSSTSLAVKGRDADEKQYLVRMLAAYLDLSGSVAMEGEQLDVKADLKGLRLQTLIELEKDSPASSSTSKGTPPPHLSCDAREILL
jgi:hypothetical protein